MVSQNGRIATGSAIMTGQVISHYRILDKIGEGGMAVIYKAEDMMLKRIVALKFLRTDAFGSQEQKSSLIREAQAAASLSHPNIRTIYGIEEENGKLFISMAYTRGMTLKERIRTGPLDIVEAVDIAVEVARGLKAAHMKGIIHRDIMSSNIMITEEGRVVILDFGMADMPDSFEDHSLVMEGDTSAYMSPEQCRGDAVDHRTDIWSLGICLYEMIAGRLPFDGVYSQAVQYEILNEDFVPLAAYRPETPGALSEIVNAALAKNPAGRYQEIGTLLVKLVSFREAFAGSACESFTADAAQPSVAILPFADISPEQDQEYFCDGIAEEIINTLNKAGGMRVVARTSSFSFKGKNEDIREIGRKLSVGTLLEGSVRKSGKHVRITAQLINAENGYHLWAEQYEREMEDIFSIQDEITMAVVNKLRVSLLGEESAAMKKRPTENLDAFNLYLMGRYWWNKRTERSYRQALEFFQQAIGEDPSYALAYVGVADCYNLLGWYGHLSPREAFSKSRDAAKQAIRIDAELPEARASLGWISANYDRDWAAAEKEYTKALELKPSYASAHQWYSEFLSYMGRHDEAIREAEIARDLDPLSLIIESDFGQVLYYARDIEGAVEHLKKTLEMDPDFVIAHQFLALAHAQKGMFGAALAAIGRANELAGSRDTLVLSQLGTLHAFAGDHHKAVGLLENLNALSREKYVSPFWIALIHAGLGDSGGAFEWLEKAYNERDHWMETLKVLPILDALRADPRYAGLLQRMNLS
ncbi:MAG: protein kinase [Chitinivibrionia bacterium]|nr:protein kinase [Chitinivibrionia bacterium]